MHQFPFPPEEPIKLKGKDVKPTRTMLLEKQGYKCTLCGTECTDEQAVLDHDHAKGHIRSVLHRGCNAAEGKISNALRRYGIKDAETFLLNLVAYHKLHSSNQTSLIHPTYRTAEEKKERAKNRAKKRRAASKVLPV